MNHFGLAIRSAGTLVAVGCAVYSIFFLQYNQFPFTWRVVDTHILALEPRPQASSPLQIGDRLDLRAQDFATRAALAINTLAGESYTLRVHRDGRTIDVPVAKTTPADHEINLLRAILRTLVMALGLVTLWWGRDWAAWGLTLFALAFIVNGFLDLALPPVLAFAVRVFNWTLIMPLIPIGLYVTAFALVGKSLSRRIRFALHMALAAILLAQGVLLDAQIVEWVVFAKAVALGFGQIAWLFIVALAIPVCMLLVAWPQVGHGRRPRLRWIIWSLALFTAAMAWNNLIGVRQELSTRGVLTQLAWWSMMLGGSAGLLYSVLRKRVVAMSFAVNRALVYGLTVAFVVGVFALLAAIVEKTAIGRDAGLALTIIVSLSIGLLLEALRDRINSLIERLFFRRRYAAEAALTRFARQCAYMERRDRLLVAAEEAIRRHLQPQSSAVYERSENEYLCIRQSGGPPYPEQVDVDDPAFVAMRADRREVDLGDIRSVLGTEGFAFPMTVRGVLRAALVCGARTEEYTRDERKLLAEVAHQMGTALHALRARDNEALVEDLAGGALDLPTARKRAQRLRSSPKWSVTSAS